MVNYLTRAIKFARIVKAVRNRELVIMPVFITGRCNSRCMTCSIWKKPNPQDMPVEMIEGILDSDDCKNTTFVLQGGEPILHSNIEEILEMLKRKGRKYQLFSNGILSKKLVSLVKKYDIPYVALSCDGTGEAYKRARGVDNYGNLVWLLGELKGITQLELSYIASPWNNRVELLKVAELSKRFGATLHVDVYDEIEYFGTATPRMKEMYKADDVIPFPKGKCLRLYNRWLDGDMTLPCYSIRQTCFITTDGMVSVCGRNLVSLGSLKERSLSEIWHDPETIRVQDALSYSCNGCWATCYRGIDIALTSVFPKFVLRRLL